MEYIKKYSTILQLVLLHAFATTPLESVFSIRSHQSFFSFWFSILKKIWKCLFTIFLWYVYIKSRKIHNKMSKNIHNHTVLFSHFFIYFLTSPISLPISYHILCRIWCISYVTLGSQFPISLHRFLISTLKHRESERDKERANKTRRTTSHIVLSSHILQERGREILVDII